MNREEKTTKTYRFDKEVINHAETNPCIGSFAEWASQRYREEFLTKDYLEEEKQRLEARLRDVEARLGALPHVEGLLASHEERWLRAEGVRRARRYTFEGVYSYFVNRFDRQDLSRRQFRLLLDKVKKTTG